MASGDKYCKVCGKYLGNYMTGSGNYFRLIRLKYCDKCRQKVVNYQKNRSYHERKITYKQQNAELLHQTILLTEQNRLLREENRILKAEVDSYYD